MSLRRPLANLSPYSLRNDPIRVLPCFFSILPLRSRWRLSSPRRPFATVASLKSVTTSHCDIRLLSSESYLVLKPVTYKFGLNSGPRDVRFGQKRICAVQRSILKADMCGALAVVAPPLEAALG